MAVLVSCDPSTLANLARCLSSCGGDQMAIKSYLLCQYAFQKSCTQPTSPDNAGTSATTQTTITITWTEGASPQAPVDGFRIRWGTTNHSNDLGDVTVGPAPLSYTITGLSPGQTIFFDIFALSGGCQSANSTGGTATTSAAVCAFAAAWAARVVANGGANPSAATQAAICTFQAGLVTDGLDGLMISWSAIVPDNLIAAITPQLVGPGGVGGGFDPWINTGFVGGDLTVNGLIGNGTTKFLDTGLAPSVMYASINDGGITIYAFTNPNATNCDVGVGNANQTSLQMYLGTTYWDAYSGVPGAGRISAANAGFTGYVSGNRTAANSTAIYEANSGVPHNTLVSDVTSGGSLPTSTFFVFAFSTAGVGGSFSNQRLSFVAFHHGLSSAQSVLFFNRIQALRTALGGGAI